MQTNQNEPKTIPISSINDLENGGLENSSSPSRFLDVFDEKPVDYKPPPPESIKPLTPRQIRYQKWKNDPNRKPRKPGPPRGRMPEFISNEVVDDAPQALRIVTKFGGAERLSKLCKMIGYRLASSTIRGWAAVNGRISTTGGYIPHWAWPAILEAARADGLVLVSEDFDPRPFRLYKPLPLNKRQIGAHDVVPPKAGRKKGGKNGKPPEEEPL